MQDVVAFLKSDIAPAWFQAVGSIAAVVAVWAVAAGDRRNSRNDRRKTQLTAEANVARMAATLAELGRDAVSAARTSVQTHPSDAWAWHIRQLLQPAASRISRFDLHQLGSRDAVRAFQDLDSELRLAVGAFEASWSEIQKEPEEAVRSAGAEVLARGLAETEGRLGRIVDQLEQNAKASEKRL